MPVYHQLGHDSYNLLTEDALRGYAGAILSPVNSDAEAMTAQVLRYRNFGNYEVIFDPQLYYPRTDRTILRSWAYFPADYDTIDSGNDQWWSNLLTRLVRSLEGVRPDIICSPVNVPRAYTNGYYSQMTRVADMLCETVTPLPYRVLQTVLVNTSDLADQARVLAISSIVSRTNASGLYVVFVGDVDPRRELSDTEELKGAMSFINILETNGISVLVGFCSSDMILWKAAGATSCATGKFWNLRRFTPSRWDPTEGGGGQLAYWFEESLLASLRESDVVRVQGATLISTASRNNPFSVSILESIGSGQAWVAQGWRQFLYWFYDIETRLRTEQVTVAALLREAEQNWDILEDRNILMEERRNNGSWLRPWRRALAEYQNN